MEENSYSNNIQQQLLLSQQSLSQQTYVNTHHQLSQNSEPSWNIQNNTILTQMSEDNYETKFI